MTETKLDLEEILKLIKALNLQPNWVIMLGDLKEEGAIRAANNLSSIPKLISAHNKGIEVLF